MKEASSACLPQQTSDGCYFSPNGSASPREFP